VRVVPDSYLVRFRRRSGQGCQGGRDEGGRGIGPIGLIGPMGPIGIGGEIGREEENIRKEREMIVIF